MEILEQELLQVTKYAKHKKFPDNWNRSITFIYEEGSYEEVVKQAYVVAKQNDFPTQPFVIFATTRWFNFHTNAIIGEMLTEVKEIETDYLGGSRGLIVKGEPFDYRCTFYPRQFYLPIDYSVEKPKSLIKWFYMNQNRNIYFGNRIFVVFHDKADPGNSWRLRGQLGRIRSEIENVLSNGFKFIEFDFIRDKTTYHPKCAAVFITDNMDAEEPVSETPEDAAVEE
jgi:hypothetical protein